MRLIIALLGSGSVLEAPAQATSSPVIAPVLAVTTESGQAMPVLSVEAYRAEFRHLRRVGHQIDLSGPARRMTGLQRDVPETQWPFMQFCYFGFACVNLAGVDLKLREEALQEARWLIDALQTPRLTGFMAEHFGPPFGEGFSRPSVFVHGFFLNLVLRYREVSADGRYDALAHQIAGALSQAFARSEQGLLPSYPQMWWITDNLPALAALVRYDRVYGRQLSKVKDRFLRTARADYLDRHGLLASYIDPVAHRPLQGARGVAMGYALHFLREVDSDFARQQYTLARREFFRSGLGFAAVREFPEGDTPAVDVDSGPVLFGLGTAASGFGVAAAALMGDEVMAEQLLKSSAALAMPELKNGELHYSAMPPVGQAVILFGKTELLKLQLAGGQTSRTGP